MRIAVLPNAIARNAMNGSIWWVISSDWVQWVIWIRWVEFWFAPKNRGDAFGMAKHSESFFIGTFRTHP
jgi:hypothetical protein